MGLKSGISNARAKAKERVTNVKEKAKAGISKARAGAKQRVTKAKTAIFNIPNILSLSRVFLAPLVLIFMTIRIKAPAEFFEQWGIEVSLGDLLAGAVFIIAAITDSLDGYIARRFKLVTTLGKFIDSLADKVLVIAALLALVELNRLPSWMVMIIITREFVVTGLRLVAAAQGVVIAASPGGKIKTFTQIVAIIFLILNLPGRMAAMWIAMILTVTSGMQYLMNGKKILLEGEYKE
ncbi:MAG: CDP-diacylglycerol--glycerol-3-phosphate 3-phosphatidyltransferase [Synergistaceae bacterium]|nr:CDP-diacylglycerol--glycerol-3-phosphate 3-phosphatidyltransferase [Synergistaceae bacterium]